MGTITATELAKRLSDILNRIRYRGERFIIERNGEPIASIGPVHSASGITMQRLIARIGDVTPPHDGFADDLERIQATQPLASIRGRSDNRRA